MPSEAPLTISDLRNWLERGLPADGLRPGVAVIGDPVAHSRSPGMHQPALDARDLGLRYVKIHVLPGEVAEVFSLLRKLGFTGTNVTVPHKLEALRACTEVDGAASLFQAVNTVHFRPDGVTHGSNTDGPGLSAAVEEAFGKKLCTSSIAIAGAGGGAGRAAALQCALDGSPKIVLINRTVAKAESVAAEIRQVSPAMQAIVLAMDDFPAIKAALAGCDLLVNATSAGMKPEDPLPVPVESLHPGLAVYDMIYSPPETALLAAARNAGCPTANGLSMLIHQGAISFSRWFGGAPPVEIMRHALMRPNGP
ncbi:MAG: shikimate dehydrogenase [Verrucomicrobiales bacterium]